MWYLNFISTVIYAWITRVKFIAEVLDLFKNNSFIYNKDLSFLCRDSSIYLLINLSNHLLTSVCVYLVVCQIIHYMYYRQHWECVWWHHKIFRIIGLLWGESTGPRWFSLTKSSVTELWFFSSAKQMVKQTMVTPVRRNSVHYDVIIMLSATTTPFKYDRLLCCSCSPALTKVVSLLLQNDYHKRHMYMIKVMKHLGLFN